MIDLHCHILPGIDDGPSDYSLSLEMAKKAASEGITQIVATPHHKNGVYLNKKMRILEQVKEFNKILEYNQIPLVILPGQEIRMYGEIVEDYQKGEILTLNNTGKYLFIEFPTKEVPHYAEKLLINIQFKGFIPIIVHPERNHRILEDPDILYRFINQGALAQITAGSLVGVFGNKIQKFSHQLIEANLIHLLASDAHNVVKRPFHMRNSLEIIINRYGKDMMYEFLENAQCVIEGKNCFKMPPEQVKKKKFLGIF